MPEFQFNADFQDTILACMIHRPDKMERFGHIIKPTYFSGIRATTVARVALRYQEERGRFPGWSTLGQLATDEMKRLNSDDTGFSDYIEGLRDQEVTDADYASERVREFCKEQAVLLAIQKSVDIFKKNEVIRSGSLFQDMFRDAMEVGENLEDDGYILHRSVRAVVDKISKVDYGVRTGYPQYDAIWRRGWCPGWLIVPLAPPKRYKTTWSINVACNMVGPSIQADVLYYPCEISQELAALRALLNLTGMTEEDLYESPERFIRAAEESMQTKMAGNFLFKAFPSKSVTIADIGRHAERVIARYKLNVKAVFIDYAETIAPSKANSKLPSDQQHASIYTDARALAAKLGCCVIMPDRCNRETVSLSVPNMHSFQGAFQKAGIVDVAIGLCSTDEEYAANVLRSFVFLNRHGAAYQHFKGKVSPEVMQINVGEEIPYTPDDNATNSGGNGTKHRKNSTGKKGRTAINEDDILPAELRD